MAATNGVPAGTSEPSGEIINTPDRRSLKRKATKMAEEEPALVEYLPACAEEKSTWKGFCEIESEPCVFNELLRQLGTRHWEIQEIYDIDELLVREVKGLNGFVFLYQVPDDDEEEEEEEEEIKSAGSEHVWFANQIAGNACATIALINILMNTEGHPGIDQLGEQLRKFKAATIGMSPAYRGVAIADSDFIRQAHSSFARRIDMWDADLGFEQRAEKHGKKAKKTPRKASKKKQSADGDEAYHFVAYLPDSTGSIWMLDGFNTAPHHVGNAKALNGTHNSVWWHTVLPLISERIVRLANGGIAFNLLALCDNSTLPNSLQLAIDHFKITYLEDSLAQLDALTMTSGSMPHSFKQYHPVPSHDEREPPIDVELRGDSYIPGVHVTAPSSQYGLDDEIWAAGKAIAEAQIQSGEFEGKSAEQLTLARLKAYWWQKELTNRILDGEPERRRGRAEAQEKQHDYGPTIHVVLNMLNENGKLREIGEAPA